MIGPVCKQLDEQLTKVQTILTDISTFNSSVKYLGNIDFSQGLSQPISQSEVYSLSERLKELHQLVESTTTNGLR